MDRGGLQKSFKAIVQDVGIHKAITIHTLRHCYAFTLPSELRSITQKHGKTVYGLLMQSAVKTLKTFWAQP